MNEFIMRFIKDNLTNTSEKSIMEVGSLNINGSARDILESSTYMGIDICNGNGVDLEVDATFPNLYKILGTYDIVISTETMEHVHDWRRLVTNIKNFTKPGGTIMVSTRSPGYAYHMGNDYWRYTIEDIIHIFSDCNLLTYSIDPEPGICAIFIKPYEFTEVDLSKYNVLPVYDHTIAMVFSEYRDSDMVEYDVGTVLALLREYNVLDRVIYSGRLYNMISTIYSIVDSDDDITHTHYDAIYLDDPGKYISKIRDGGIFITKDTNIEVPYNQRRSIGDINIYYV